MEEGRKEGGREGTGGDSSWLTSLPEVNIHLHTHACTRQTHGKPRDRDLLHNGPCIHAPGCPPPHTDKETGVEARKPTCRCINPHAACTQITIRLRALATSFCPCHRCPG